MKKIYFETVRNGLVPVSVIGKTGNTYQLLVSKDTVGYKAGETIESTARHIVHKATRRGTYIMVSEVGTKLLDEIIGERNECNTGT